MCFILCALQPSVDPYGFERSEDFDYDSYEELMSEYLVVLTRRSIKWSKLLKRKGKVQKNVKRESTSEKKWIFEHTTQPSKTLTLPLLLSKALCSQRDSQRAPDSDLDGSQWGSRPAREELGILSDAAGSQPRSQTGGNHPHRSQAFFISKDYLHLSKNKTYSRLLFLVCWSSLAYRIHLLVLLQAI